MIDKEFVGYQASTGLKIKNILSNYSGESPAIKGNLFRLLNSGILANSGKMLILPVDQGFEHGPNKSFDANPEAYSPLYHYQLALDIGASAYASNLGMLSVGADEFAGRIPTILKLNSNNSLNPSSSHTIMEGEIATYENSSHSESKNINTSLQTKIEPLQATTSSVYDAVRLGCVGIGYTLYPGSSGFNDSVKELKEIIKEARHYGLLSVVWAYPRGSGIFRNNEDFSSARDVICHAAHMACSLGAHIVKVKLPKEQIMNQNAEMERSEYILRTNKANNLNSLAMGVAAVVRACFDGRRIVLFSGGDKKNDDELMQEIAAIAHGGGGGSIIGRNLFQRNKSEAIILAKNIADTMRNTF